MIRAALLFAALFITVYATITFALGMDADFYLAAYTGIGALISYLAVEWLVYRRDHRARMCAQRAEVWERRDREAGAR